MEWADVVLRAAFVLPAAGNFDGAVKMCKKLINFVTFNSTNEMIITSEGLVKECMLARSHKPRAHNFEQIFKSTFYLHNVKRRA